MIQKFFNSQFSTAMHLQLFKQVLTCCLTVSMLVYVSIHLIFFDLPFEWMEEIIMIVKTLLTGAYFAAGISSILIIADAIQYAARKCQRVRITLSAKKMTIAMILLVIAITACNAQPRVSGTIKDNTTELTAIYNKIKPGRVLLIMNDEVIHHTDIPIGESFMLVNYDIKGLTIKNGKVSVGCALTIKNKAGKIMLQDDDLFKGNDILDKDSADYLRCVVHTGKPMRWEEKYDITVIFKDKYGTGKIENKVTIRCIDLP